MAHSKTSSEFGEESTKRIDDPEDLKMTSEIEEERKKSSE